MGKVNSKSLSRFVRGSDMAILRLTAVTSERYCRHQVLLSNTREYIENYTNDDDFPTAGDGSPI